MRANRPRPAFGRGSRARRLCTRGLASAALLLGLLSCRNTEVPVYTTQFNAFGGAVDLSIVGIQRDRAATAAEALERDFEFFDRALFRDESDRMVRINEGLAAGERFAAPPSLIPLIARTQDLSAQSGGLFDPTIGRLTHLWGVDVVQPAAHRPPDDTAIRQLLETEPSMADIDLDGIELHSRNPAVQLDFDSIASAYAMDVAIDSLRRQGVRSAMINAGGDVRVIGNRSGRPWRVPVPRASGTGVLGILDVRGNVSLYTASAQRRNFVYQGEVYHAVIDPRTGYPATAAASATVLYEGDALTAAGAAHALMIAGPEQWPSIAERMGIDYALVTDRDGNLHLSPAMDRTLNLLDANTERSIHPLSKEQTRPSDPRR
ncbi:FAD:protein FMN transferase [Halochromatium glycolicum]|uniref:FAD:protein FMN transferase n=1 Tax=Halochromatium glycolicum TaxID=85075 RepID=UPI00190A4353